MEDHPFRVQGETWSQPLSHDCQWTLSLSRSLPLRWLPKDVSAAMQKTARAQVAEALACILPPDVGVVFAVPVLLAKESWHGALAWLLLQTCAGKTSGWSEKPLVWKHTALGVNLICVLCHSLSAVLALLLMSPSVHGLLP